ncbi:MAG TPA: hypothetical protein VMU66_07935 [Gaiellales bacterium]|nr:hypothetical protein [Gaiellales bacterium]
MTAAAVIARVRMIGATARGQSAQARELGAIGELVAACARSRSWQARPPHRSAGGTAA